MQASSGDIDRASTGDLRVPAGLDLPDTGRWFSAQETSRQLRVLFIVSQPAITSAISVHSTLMRFLRRDRVEVHVLYNRRAAGEPYLSAGNSVLRVLPPDAHLVPAEFGPVGNAPRQELIRSSVRSAVPAIRDSAALLRYIQRHRIDVIHCEEGPRNGFYAYALSRLTRPKCVTHFHWNYGSWMSPLSRLAVQRSDAIVTVSRWTGRVLHQAGVEAQRIMPVLNGIDLDRWDRALVDAGAIRAEFRVSPSAPLVVMVAQLTAWKRQHVLVEAFRMVVERHPEARLLLVGTESNPTNAPGQPTYHDRLRRLVSETGLDGHVIFTGQRPDVREILAAADLSAHPSVDDPCALAHIEAMAMGKPIVAVRSGGTPELVAHGQNGLLGPIDDTQQLAANITALLDDPALRAQMGARAQARAHERFSAQRMSDEVEAVYRLVSGRAPVTAPV
jgi:glycosyltransferase involved in cell wall biosynthesis